MLSEISTFYKNLYKSKDDRLNDVNLNDIIYGEDILKLDRATSAKIDKSINVQEVHKALKNMKNNKTPGPDGFPAEF